MLSIDLSKCKLIYCKVNAAMGKILKTGTGNGARDHFDLSG